MNNQQKVVLAIHGMDCQRCKSQVTNALEKTASVNSVSVNLHEKLARVQGENLDAAALIAVVEQLGYRAQAVSPETTL